MGNCGSGEFNEDNFKISGFHRGLVLDNVDPDQYGRIKIQVYGFYGSDIPNANIPWAVPASSLFAGAGSGFGAFVVPEIGSEVFVFFEAEDIYQPVYFAEAPNGVKGLPSERTSNYPYRRVWKTKNGIAIYIDDKDKEIKINHPSGSYIKIDTSGNIEIKGTTVHVNPV
jgi:uncharacterized protein involved in type VI secretion and phage assembly